jgi:hypothetical protein
MPNARKTLFKYFSIDTLITQSESAALRDRLEQFRDNKGLRLWGLGADDSRLELEPGDIVLLVWKKGIAYYTEVVERLDDPDGEIGRIVGWRKYPANQTWRPVLLTEVSNISGLFDVVNSLVSGKNFVRSPAHFFQLLP